jgi:pilus assembly protein CpaF
MSENPISKLMSLHDVSEIMVNSYDTIFIEQKGVLKKTDLSFVSAEEYENYLIGFLKNDGHDVESSYYFDGATAGVFRYNIVFPPMTVNSPVLTLRRFSIDKFDLFTLVEKGSISQKCMLFLDRLVKAKMNIVISGGTGTGKTTFLQAMCSAIPIEERIVSIEDTPELSINNPNWVQMLSVKSPLKKPVSIKDCLVNSLRMRPTRIIVGECRKDETFEMLQAMNTGHEGSMTTIHANNPVDCLMRLENLIYSSGHDVDVNHIRTQIGDTVDYIVQLERSVDGTRSVSEVMELDKAINGVITRSPIFKRVGKEKELLPTGVVPARRKEIEEMTSKFGADFFSR